MVKHFVVKRVKEVDEEGKERFVVKQVVEEGPPVDEDTPEAIAERKDTKKRRLKEVIEEKINFLTKDVDNTRILFINNKRFRGDTLTPQEEAEELFFIEAMSKVDDVKAQQQELEAEIDTRSTFAELMEIHVPSAQIKGQGGWRTHTDTSYEERMKELEERKAARKKQGEG